MMQTLRRQCVLMIRPPRSARKCRPITTASRRFASSSSSNNNNNSSDDDNNNNLSSPDDYPFPLPNPTWSVKSLQLDVQHEPISQDELERLAKRAVLWLPQQDDNQQEEQASALRQDVGNMMHLIQQVVTATQEITQQKDDDNDDKETDEVAAWIYDAPRGVTTAPLRRYHDDDDDNGEESIKEEAKDVWKSMLEPKTTRVGAHSYFVIPTEASIKAKEDGNSSS